VIIVLAENAATAQVEVPFERQRKAGISTEIKAETIEKLKAQKKARIEQINLPDDTSSRFIVKEVRINGNKLISIDELVGNIPPVYNASDKPADKAEPGDLYDLRAIQNVILNPGQPHEVSRRAMQGFTEYILSVYEKHGHAGIYVYISAQAVKGNAQLQDEILPIEIVEAEVSETILTHYDTERNKKEKGILRDSIMTEWSPVKAGQTVNQKKLDDFINLLNLNPDRYVSAVISRGSEPNSLALGYDIYEANPWHFYVQVDNSGPEERQWAPVFGIINTNATGRDDRFTAIYQAALDSIEDNYSLFGSYEFPVLTPRLRLTFYGGHNNFNISGGGGIDFLGKGTFYGGLLRFNVFQTDDWFFDVTSSLSREHSEVTPSLFPQMGSDVDIDLWGIGVNVHRSNDKSNTSFGFDRVQSIGGSPQKKFWDPVTFTGARMNSERDFAIYTTTASHSQYLDPNKIHRLSGSLRWITSNERLAPSKMTTFGGLYSVRGYEEDEIVADGGLLISAQYEFDLVKYSESKQAEAASDKDVKKSWLRKFALLGFTDYARAKTNDPVPGEDEVQEIYSTGTGAIIRIGEHCDARIYYGWPLVTTVDTTKGRGRWSFSFILRW
jgi:hemolysin activation/secretion protein